MFFQNSPQRASLLLSSNEMHHETSQGFLALPFLIQSVIGTSSEEINLFSQILYLSFISRSPRRTRIPRTIELQLQHSNTFIILPSLVDLPFQQALNGSMKGITLHFYVLH